MTPSWALTDAFCREHLDDEYGALCRKLAGVLARKRPSPLPSGKPESWACGIVRTSAGSTSSTTAAAAAP